MIDDETYDELHAHCLAAEKALCAFILAIYMQSPRSYKKVHDRAFEYIKKWRNKTLVQVHKDIEKIRRHRDKTKLKP